VAVDPERIRQRMKEAEESGRPCLGEQEARSALCALAVVFEGEPQGEQDGGVVMLERAS
jgi:hypothetical protein